MDDVTIRSIDDVTQIKVKPFGMIVRFDKDKLQIRFEGSEDNTIALGGNTTFLFDGDTHFITNGELGFISKGHDIHLDSVDANIHLNSRLSKPLKDNPESVAYRNRKRKKVLQMLPMLPKAPVDELKGIRERLAYLEEIVGV
jgi:hypothetical protein